MASAELRLSLPVDAAREAVASTLTDQGFDADAGASGGLRVTRTALGDAVDEDSSVEGFDVQLSEVPEGTLAVFERSSGDAARDIDAAWEAARLVGARLAQQGLLAVAAPAPEGPFGVVPPAPAYTTSSAGFAAGYPGAPVYGATALAAPPQATSDPAAPRHTNVVAIVAIVLGLLLPPGGIVAGAVALNQIKRTGEKGRELAIGGIVAGAVLTVVGAVALVALTAFAVFGLAAGASADPYAPGTDGGVTVAPDEQAPFDPTVLTEGACLDDLPGGVVAADNIVDCAQLHSFEVFGGFDVPDGDGTFPGDDALGTAALEGCDAAFETYVGLPYNDSALDYYYVGPTEQTWATGDREVFCLLYDPNVEQSTGSLAGSGR